MLVYRLPRGIPLWGKKQSDKENYNYSYCPQCSHRLGFLDLFPFLSWLVQRGKCRYCQCIIPVRYICIELLSAVVAVSFVFHQGITWPTFVLMLCVPVLISLIVIDWDFQILPDALNGALAVLGLAYIGVAIGVNGLMNGCIAMVVYGGLFWLLRFLVSNVLKKEAMGWGDIKFAMAAGIWLGVSFLPLFLMVSGFSGIIFGIMYRMIKRRDLFPFGPCLIFSWYVCFLFGELILL